MAEIQEVFEDFSEGVKKTVKKKPFIIAAVGVGVVGLYVAYKKSRTANQSDTVTAFSYPSITGGGGGGSDDSTQYEEILAEKNAQFEEILAENNNYYEGLLGDMEMTYQEDIAGLTETITNLSNRVDTAESKANEYEAKLERETVISQMRANSELYNAITDKATKDALHAENMALAEKMGWVFDAETGNYFEGNSVVYTTTKQQAGAINYATRPAAGEATNKYTNNKEYNNQVTESVLKSTASSSLGYDPNVDYSLAIVKAKESGASAETIQALQTARQNKIDSVYGGVDPAKKETQEKVK